MRAVARGWWVPLVAVVALLGSGIWLAVDQSDGFGHRGSMGWSRDHQAVEGLAAARDRAEEFAATLDPDLRAGEVMWFTKNFYAELEGSDGTKATEILIDPSTGAVRLEFGPAMMWNTRYGMAAGVEAPAELSAAQAEQLAQQWEDDHDGLAVAEAEAFPGYYTLHTLEQGRIVGMLSVNAVTGDVWDHGWHGEFRAMSES